jgi:hypothetical protein
MISAISAPIETIKTHLPSPSQIMRNGVAISKIALPAIAIATLPLASAGLASYTACVATCPAMAAMAPPGLFAFTFESCMLSCNWMLSPTCP